MMIHAEDQVRNARENMHLKFNIECETGDNVPLEYKAFEIRIARRVV